MELPPQIAQAFSLVAAGRTTEAVRLLERLAMPATAQPAISSPNGGAKAQIVPRDFAMRATFIASAGQAGSSKDPTLHRLPRRRAGVRAIGAEPASFSAELAKIDPPGRAAAVARRAACG